MNAAIRFRVALFGLAIFLAVSLLMWTAQNSWQRFHELGQRLTAVELESFRISGVFQQQIRKLNNLLLHYGIEHNADEWAAFNRESRLVDKWIDDHREALKTQREKVVLQKIDAAYDKYRSAARVIQARVTAAGNQSTTLDEFADLVNESEQLLNLGYELADAHRESLNQFLAKSNRSLKHLHFLLTSLVLLLLLFFAALAVVIYRDMIAPLRLRLVASEAHIERQEKLAALGLLAAGVAHEIRNPLTAIKARLFTQEKKLKPGTPEHDDAQVIGREINRLDRIVKDFLRFARPSEPDYAIVPARQPLQEVQALLAIQLEKNNIQLTVSAETDAAIRIDPEQIKQVLINLVQNAADSIGANGRITLRARCEVRRLGDRPSEAVVLEVGDSGKGIPAEVQKRLFDPFFSTKDGGTGLGLPIAARIVDKHGGILQYQTRVNHGTTFGVVLPRAGSRERE